jgi:hypothetical protein
VGQGGVRIGQLPLSRLAAQLEPGLVEHPQPAGADRVAERLQTAVDVDRESPLGVEVAGQHVLPRMAALGEAEVLHEHDLGRREAVVDLGERQSGEWVVDPRLGVGVPGGVHHLGERGEVVAGIDPAPHRAGRQ